MKNSLRIASQSVGGIATQAASLPDIIPFCDLLITDRLHNNVSASARS